MFVLGVPRSGTTLVEQIIAAHPQAHGGGELSFVPEMLSALTALGGGAEFPDCLDAITAEEFGDAVSGYLSRMAAIGPDKLRVVDKSPFNHRYLGLLADLFPGAHFIYCRRNERDIGLSCYFQNFSSPLAWATDLGDIGHYIRGYGLLMEHWGEVLGSRIHEVSYERLVADPEPAVRDLIDAVELHWDDRCLNFDKSKNLVQTASKWQVRQPIYNQSVGQWRHYETPLAPLLDKLRGSSVNDVG
ncbi:MAG: sulfotransferase [Proteobacteria bacterium]|nr:sulfotransferase [Pseudomonadota bacterium]